MSYYASRIDLWPSTVGTVTEVLVVIRRINDMIGGIFCNIPTNLGNLSCNLVHLQLGK
jgi:hypothetical protein